MADSDSDSLEQSQGDSSFEGSEIDSGNESTSVSVDEDYSISDDAGSEPYDDQSENNASDDSSPVNEEESSEEQGDPSEEWISESEEGSAVDVETSEKSQSDREQEESSSIQEEDSQTQDDDKAKRAELDGDEGDDDPEASEQPDRDSDDESSVVQEQESQGEYEDDDEQPGGVEGEQEGDNEESSRKEKMSSQSEDSETDEEPVHPPPAREESDHHDEIEPCKETGTANPKHHEDSSTDDRKGRVIDSKPIEAEEMERAPDIVPRTSRKRFDGDSDGLGGEIEEECPDDEETKTSRHEMLPRRKSKPDMILASFPDSRTVSTMGSAHDDMCCCCKLVPDFVVKITTLVLRLDLRENGDLRI